ncbi:MAG: hypothetical protein HY587_03000 [Candidatus Omnitrophica bacterium]|nr:hypothetical protein [Candidatus Omnitrophota bacterium]
MRKALKFQNVAGCSSGGRALGPTAPRGRRGERSVRRTVGAAGMTRGETPRLRDRHANRSLRNQ